jgi:hypothetical protein
VAATPRFSLRVDPETLDLWRRSAEAEGLSVTAWIRQRCAVSPTEQAIRLDPPAKPERKAKPKPTVCAQPRGARVTVNAGLGLYRCGACGDTLRR